MVLAEKIKEYSKALGLDIVGICESTRLSCEPAGSRPEDFLKNAKSVVVFGRKVPDTVIKTLADTVRMGEPGQVELKVNPKTAMRRALKQSAYGVFGHGAGVNMLMIYDAYLIAKLIEDETGMHATPVATGPIQGEILFNVQHAAVAAGLGELSWCNRVATPEFGSRVILGAVLTDAELDSDPMYSGERLCNPEQCHICTDMCPNAAISNQSQNVVILGGKEMKTALIHKNRCKVVRCAMRKDFGARADFVPSEDPTDEEIRQGFRAMPPAHGGELSHQASWKCDLCVGFCPIAGGDKLSGMIPDAKKSGGDGV